MRLLHIPAFPAVSRVAVPLPGTGEREGRKRRGGGPKGRCGFKCAPCVARAAIALMQSDRDRCDISVPTHFHTTSHRLGVTHIPLLWSCPPAAGQHNDARMNLAIALTAARYGAAIANYTEVVHLLKRADPQTGKGEGLRSALQGWQEFDVRAKCVINATGPFTDTRRKMDDQKNPQHLSAWCWGAHRHAGAITDPYFLSHAHDAHAPPSPDDMELLDPVTSSTSGKGCPNALDRIDFSPFIAMLSHETFDNEQVEK
ncbi:glycerol-3-phosphate dehydrogenase%2C mitochondrial [Xyrichtys novacula]|uniref:glycerol-3-phosphate dehydrogenase n=1 Tax=Xyrichtys novacula TaxID=13765 RepID=A0AAV1H1V8_XYRNO|nr:glycerol-3-phosphate dehydrogenase%2C mitochondrial [Xyrichtys novacula]